MTASFRVLVVALAALVGILAAACGEGDLIREAHPTTLVGAWRAIEINGRATVPGSEPTLRVLPDQLTGTTGCNSFFGTYRYESSTGNVAISVTGMTAAGCADAALSAVEAAYVEALAEVSSASIDPDGRLLLRGVDVDILFAVDAIGG